eukprot:TRINITY_DN4396_c0_g1_i1.p1 TRINITY_DN4396_c0_g1~~TRINITY_DN4396_c0_g1_i1.p1  ORF type:complete len:431 (+),score=62.25 TRINITY_DN4396_c0_g1_i1:90-1382(+)
MSQPQKVLVRVVEGRGLSDVLQGDCKLLVSLGEVVFESRAIKNSELGVYKWQYEAIFEVEDPATESIRVDLWSQKSTRGRVICHLKDLNQGRSSMWLPVLVPKKVRSKFAPEVQLVLKVFGFGKASPNSSRTHAKLVPVPHYDPIEVTVLDVMLHPASTELIEMPTDAQVWTELERSMEAFPNLSSKNPVVRITPKARLKRGKPVDNEPPPTSLKVNISFVKAFMSNYKVTRTHKLLVSKLGTEYTQQLTTDADFWNTLVSAVYLRRQCEKFTSFRVGDQVAVQVITKRAQEAPRQAKVQSVISRSGERQRCIIQYETRSTETVPFSKLRPWKERLSLVVSYTKKPLEQLYMSTTEWDTIKAEWESANKRGKYAWLNEIDTTEVTDDLPLFKIITGVKFPGEDTIGDGNQFEDVEDDLLLETNSRATQEL